MPEESLVTDFARNMMFTEGMRREHELSEVPRNNHSDAWFNQKTLIPDPEVNSSQPMPVIKDGPDERWRLHLPEPLLKALRDSGPSSQDCMNQTNIRFH